ncbi:MAG: MMPL family transporter [Acidobacteria bacterium]|nr:MMPL family transporter [Acidobacteriota bacterium]
MAKPIRIDKASSTREPIWLRLLPVLVCLAVAALVALVFLRSVDLKPKVSENFFFSKNDPQVRADNQISKTFPETTEIDLTVTGDIASSTYADRIRELSDAVSKVPGVTDVIALGRKPGPKDLEEALKSRLWTDVLIARDRKSTDVIATVKDNVGPTTINGLQAVQRKFDRPGFVVMISGLPYVTELISRSLASDLRTFSLVALAVFGVVLLVIFRSLWILLGTFVACAVSSAATLIVTQSIHIPIGPVTANLSTMVFVMTLSPMVFLTFNWQRIREQQNSAGQAAVWSAVKETVAPSFWSAACMLLGFISLVLVPSTPLKHLGTGGAVGAAMAFASAYSLYPWFLALASPPQAKLQWTKAFASGLRSFFSEPHGLVVAGLAVFAVVAAIGLPRLNTDPPLFAYFKPGTDVRRGLEAVDRSGGSSPLKLEVEDRNGAELNNSDGYKRLWDLQHALEKDPAVGKVMSLPVMVSEIRRHWLSMFLSTKKEVGILEEKKHGDVAQQFLTPDHKRALFLLRMRETVRSAPREDVIHRLERAVQHEGFRPLLVGGEYSLLAQMGRLITSSIVSGSLILIGIFTVMGYLFSRSLRVAAAMLVTLVMIPVVVRGYIAYLGMPLDFLTSAAANLDLGMGVDAMIYLTMLAKRENADLGSWKPWSKACSHLWRPIGTNLLVICCGFGIFLLSNFPPTLRFGVFVIFGSATAASAALFMFPWLASFSIHRKKGVEVKELKAA